MTFSRRSKGVDTNKWWHFCGMRPTDFCFPSFICFNLIAFCCLTYLFVAGKVFPHWNRRTGTHGNHCYQYTDRNQIDHFSGGFFFSINVYLFLSFDWIIIHCACFFRLSFTSFQTLSFSFELFFSVYSFLSIVLWFTLVCTISKCLFLIYSDECT